MSSAPGATAPSFPSETSSAWHAATSDEALSLLETTVSGLTEEEARERLAAVGPNVLQHVEGPSALEILWRQVASPMIYVLIASGVLALAMGKTVDGLVVLAVVVVNAIIGFVQEFRAGKAIRALMDVVPRMAHVMRDGQRSTIPAADLVPGDIVVLEPGDKIPADVRLLSLRGMRVEEAMLTGESTPVSKGVATLEASAALGDRRNIGFGGTLVLSGSATGVVVATGGSTELGRISALLHEADPLETPLVRQLGEVGKWIALAIVVVAVLLLAVGFLRGYPVVDALLVAVTLAVAAIPEGLPAIVTIALAIGVQRMARRRAVIRSLPAAETLGGTTVICSDKTGTLTRNEMTVTVLCTPGAVWNVEGVGYEPTGRIRPSASEGGGASEAVELLEELLTAGVLASDAALESDDEGWRVAGDPTEGALLVVARKGGLDENAVRAAWPRVDAIPFESERRFMASLNQVPATDGNGGRAIFLKGAPEGVLERCVGLDPRERAAVLARVEEFAGGGVRVLGLATRHLDAASDTLEESDLCDFRFLGLMGMIDPPRPEVITAIRECHEAGITVKMITGDHRRTAVAIGRQLELVGEDARGVEGRELEGLSETELAEVAERENVFARVAPEHKLALVRALQSRGHIVAMTGDGVNDSPALKQANIGVAMGITGTEASKEAADIVLADDNFATIAAAVEEGRRVYDNLLKSLAFVLPTNMGLALILLVAVTAFPIIDGHPLLPMTPTQTLWINLVAAVALALPLAFEAMEPNVMRRPPRSPDASLMGGFVLFRSVLVAVLMTAGAVGLFLYEFRVETAAGTPFDVALRDAQTLAVSTVILFQIFYLLTCRSLRGSILRIGLFSNPTIFLGIATVVLLQVAFVYVPFMNRLFGTEPLTLMELGRSTLVAATVLPVIALEKWLRRVRRHEAA